MNGIGVYKQGGRGQSADINALASTFGSPGIRSVQSKQRGWPTEDVVHFLKCICNLQMIIK